MKRYIFGQYALDCLARAVIKDNEPQPTEPKVFEVLLYLITNRDRVVSKKELLESVWGRRVIVTDGVVARTVMKARRLIGDDAEESVTIKTIHRIGYRFIADVEEHPVGPLRDHPSMHPPDGGDSGDDVRIAVLPFRNLSARPDLAWVDLGLMSSTIDAIAQGGGVSVVSAADLLAVVGVHDPELPLNAAAAKVRKALGVTEVVQVAVSSAASTLLMLSFEGQGPRLSKLHGSMSGADPIDLCRKLAHEIRTCLSATGTEPPVRDVPSSRESPGDLQFMRLAHGKALQAMQVERWTSAGKLLRVALDIAPHDPRVQLDYARCLVRQRDPAAEPVLQQVLSHARSNNDRGLEMRALHELAHHRHGLQRLEDAEQLLTQALDLAEELDDQDAELQLLISFAAMLVGGGRTSVADGILERAARLASALGNQVVAARVLDTRGRIAMLRDHPQEASASFSDALKLSQQFGIHGSAAFSLLHLASCHLHSGAMKEASACFNQAFDLACRSGDPMAIATSGTGSMRYGGRGCRDLAHARKVLDEMRRLHRVNSPVLQAGIEIAESIVLGMHGSLRESIELLDLAESRCRSPHFSYHAGKHRIRLLAHLGMIREAGEMSQAFELSACGRLKAFTIGAARHLQGLVQHFDGRDTEAAEHLAQALAVIPPSLERQEALLDAIWLDLDAGRREQWSRRVAELGDFLAAAVSSDFAPALLVQARLHCEAGDAAQATAMQRRYCEVLGCDEQSLAAQVLAAYRRRHESGDSAPIPRLKALPSLYDIAPGM